MKKVSPIIPTGLYAYVHGVAKRNQLEDVRS